MNLLVICGLLWVSILCTCLGALRLAQRIHSSAAQPRIRIQPADVKRPTLPMQLFFRQAGYRGPVALLYVLMAVLGAASFCCSLIVHMSPLLAAPLAAVAAVGLPLMYLQMCRQTRQQRLLEQLPSALELMANALRAGLGVNSSFEVVAQEMAAPLGQEMSQLVAEMNLGGSIEDALNRMIERNPSNDMRLLAEAVILHKQVGGNLAEVLDNLDHTIRERFMLQRELKALTAEQRITAWVLGLLPLGVGAAILVVNPNYLMILVKTTPGHYLIYLAIFLQVTGYLLLKQILTVDF